MCSCNALSQHQVPQHHTRQHTGLHRRAVASLPSGPRRQLRQGRAGPCVTAYAGSSSSSSSSERDPHTVLGVSISASREEIRTAYYERIRELHPDVNPAADATLQAAALNLAYHDLMQGARGRGSQDEESELPSGDAFDVMEAEPTELFVNPFACGVQPWDWRKLQEVATAGGDPEAALSSAGVYAGGGAIAYLTPAQKACLVAELERMEAELSYEMTAYYVTDCLLRAARVTNMNGAVYSGRSQ